MADLVGGREGRGEHRRPTEGVLPGMARSYNKVESIEHGASEHASIQHASERSATNIKTGTTTAETPVKCSPEPVENSSLEDHTANDNEALLLEVHEALNELKQRDSLELKRDH